MWHVVWKCEGKAWQQPFVGNQSGVRARVRVRVFPHGAPNCPPTWSWARGRGGTLSFYWARGESPFFGLSCTLFLQNLGLGKFLRFQIRLISPATLRRGPTASKKNLDIPPDEQSCPELFIDAHLHHGGINGREVMKGLKMVANCPSIVLYTTLKKN